MNANAGEADVMGLRQLDQRQISLENRFGTLGTIVSEMSVEVRSIRDGQNSLNDAFKSQTAEIKALATRFEESAKTNWPLILTIAGILITGGVSAVTGIWVIISQKIDVASAPITQHIATIVENQESHDKSISEIVKDSADRERDFIRLSLEVAQHDEQNKSMADDIRRLSDAAQLSAASDNTSRTDRAQLNERMTKQEAMSLSNIGERKAQVAKICQQLVEVETQVKALSNAMNSAQADVLRTEDLLWQRDFPGMHFPSDVNYYPQIAHEFANASCD